MPPLYQLPSLQQLHIREMNGLEYMTDGDINNEISTSLASPSTFFPSLERFYLENCPNLKGWWMRDIVVDKGKEATATSTIPLPSFPRLSFFSGIALRWQLGCHYFRILKGSIWLIPAGSHWNRRLRWRWWIRLLHFRPLPPPLSPN